MFCKLALRNVTRSLKDYAVYFLTLTFGVCIFYIFNSLESQWCMQMLARSAHYMVETILIFMDVFSVFVSVVLACLILYANTFLMKRRKRELATYFLLGLPTGKVSLLLVLETLLIGLLSLAQTIIQYFFFYIGLANTTGVKSSIINASSTFFAILMSSLLFRYEKLTRVKLLGCAAGFAGVILINLAGGSFDFHMKLTGEGFILIAALSYALSSVLVKKFSARENPVMLSGWQFILGGLILAAG